MEGKIFACFGRKYLLWCGVNAAGEAAANVQGESLKAAAVISNGDIELPGVLLIYYVGEAVANVQGESLKAAAVIRKNDF